MTVKWERFVGSTDTFAVRLSFMPDPHPSAAVDPDDGASWGSLQIWVNGQNLCAHVDQGEVLHSVHWYLLPFIEWLTEAWNPLFHEERLPNRNFSTAVETLSRTRNAPPLADEPEILAWEEEWYDWWSRHALRSARSGGLFPNVVFRRVRDLIEISWQEEPIAGASEGFAFSAVSGAVLLQPTTVAANLYELARAVVQYLSGLNPASTRLAELQKSVDRLRRPGESMTRTRWLAGMHRLPAFERRLQSVALDVDLESSWSRIVSSLRESGGAAAVEAVLAEDATPLVTAGASQAALLFGSVAPTVTQADVSKLAKVLMKQFSKDATENSDLRALTRHVPLEFSTPHWEQGYELAEEFYDEIGRQEDWVDIEGILTWLGVDQTHIQLDDTSIRACTVVGPQHRPATVLNLTSSFSAEASAVRFTLAHELCHLLFDRALGQRLSIASGPWAPRGIERRANAFAAMLLMPSTLVRRALADLPDPVSDLDGLSAFAQRLKVSSTAATRHLYNLTLMTEDERDELLRRVSAAN